jgi:hypothetical protein
MHRASGNMLVVVLEYWDVCMDVDMTTCASPI